MIVKVCGIKSISNITDINESIDMVGINFYKPSPRYVELPSNDYSQLPESVKRVGVFVNEEYDKIIELSKEYNLDFVQLHGDESVDYGTKLSQEINVIKVLRIANECDLANIHDHDYASYLLLDTKTKMYGGSGSKFDWNLLNFYTGKIPFLLSGGITPRDVKKVLSISHPKFAGVDVNSGFEVEQGIKDMNEVNRFTTLLKYLR